MSDAQRAAHMLYCSASTSTVYRVPSITVEEVCNTTSIPLPPNFLHMCGLPPPPSHTHTWQTLGI